MIEPEFNLLDEPWIRVRRPDCRVEEVSLKTLFAHAHEYEDLAGETPAQDLAMLRLLLAVLHCVFSRKNEKGEDRPLSLDVLKSKALREEAVRRWGALWELRRFPYEPIDEYLEQWRHRFWLFHEDRPFWQVASVKKEILRGKLAYAEAKSKEKKEKGEDDKKKGKNSSKEITEDTLTPNALSKLNGEISQSANKDRLFNVRSGDMKEELSYSEAARWLVNLNAWDDTGLKKANLKEQLPTAQVGWLGQLGCIQAIGNTLFETLLLNLVLLQDGDKTWTEAEKPIWEKEKLSKKERAGKACPENSAELLTWQSRRLLLNREKKRINGFWILSGDFIESDDGTAKEDVLAEQMTVWKEEGKANRASTYIPKLHNEAHQMWREFGGMFCEEQNTHLPGIVRWNGKLYRELGVQGNPHCTYRIISMCYDGKKSSARNLFCDQLSFAKGILTDFDSQSDSSWSVEIKNAVKYCDRVAEEVGLLELRLLIASGGTQEKEKSKNSKGKESKSKKRRPKEDKSNEKVGKKAQERYYSRIDFPFRQWLYSINPSIQGRAKIDKILEWKDRAKGIALVLGKEMVREAGTVAFVGRLKGKEDEKRYYDAPQAYNQFCRELSRIQMI